MTWLLTAVSVSYTRPHEAKKKIKKKSSLTTDTEGASTSLSLRLLLHHLRDLHVCIEELCGASVEADAFALVELALAVFIGYTLLCADAGKAGLTVSMVSRQAQLIQTAESLMFLPGVHLSQ